MALLGKFIKQPDEVESYSVQLIKALSLTDELVGAYILPQPSRVDTPKRFADSVIQVTPEQVGGRFITSASIVLEATAVGGRYYIANSSQIASIEVATSDAVPTTNISVPPRAGVVVRYDALGYFVEEMRCTASLISNQGDQRVRVFVSGGVDRETYKVEVTSSTAEGRVLQDEFLVKIKDI